MKKLLLSLLLVLGFANGAGAQFVVPNSFTVFTKLLAAKANTNFTTLADALNRTGGTLTGNVDVSDGVTIDGADISTYLAGGKLTALSAAADSIKVGGGITAHSVALIDTTGKIPAISSTNFSSLDASNLTNLAAANLTGTISNATQDLITRTGTVISGTWSALFGAVSGAPLITLNGSNFTTGIVAPARLGTGSLDSSMLLRGDGVWATLAGSSVPSGLILPSASGTCPTGFTEYTVARGRAIMGLPLSGTSAGTVGTALSNLEDRSHSHSIPSLSVGGVTSGTNITGLHGHTGTTSGPSGTVVVGDVPGIHVSSPGHTHTFSSDLNGDHSHTFTSAGGSTSTSTTGTVNTSSVVSYIQLPFCQRN